MLRWRLFSRLVFRPPAVLSGKGTGYLHSPNNAPSFTHILHILKVKYKFLTLRPSNLLHLVFKSLIRRRSLCIWVFDRSEICSFVFVFARNEHPVAWLAAIYTRCSYTYTCHPGDTAVDGRKILFGSRTILISGGMSRTGRKKYDDARCALNLPGVAWGRRVTTIVFGRVVIPRLPSATW